MNSVYIEVKIKQVQDNLKTNSSFSKEGKELSDQIDSELRTWMQGDIVNERLVAAVLIVSNQYGFSAEELTTRLRDNKIMSAEKASEMHDLMEGIITYYNNHEVIVYKGTVPS